MPTGATNGQNLEVTITIQVREKVNLLTNPGFENGKTGWGIGYSSLNNGIPAAEGNYALQIGSHNNGKTSFNMLFPSNTTELAKKVAAEGAGLYYVGAQVRDYSKENEIAHNNALQAYIRLGYKTDVGASSSSNKGYTETVTLSSNAYVTTGGVFNLTGEDVWLRTDLYLKSATAFTSQWVLVDAFEFIPLKVALKAEPAVITEVKTQIQSRFVALNYDKYVGENWKESLGLPTTIEAQTENGDPVTLGVTWNYSSLDLTKTGKYTITGTLDDSAYPNPKDLTVQQHIYVRNPENLFANSSFENATAGWSFGSTSALYGTPAALGDYALQVKSPSSSKTSQNIMFPSNTTELAENVTQAGIGQYYISAKVRDYLREGEVAHTDPLQAYIRLGYKTDVGASSSINKGYTETVTLNGDGYVTTSGVFHMTGEEVWLRTDLYLKSATAFTSQWVLVDDMQFFALNVLIPLGEEPADITEVTEGLPVRAVVQNYDQYVGINWKTALGLPTSVEVLTAKGTKAKVNVSWDYSVLDLTKTGKYILVGTLDDSACPNPYNLQVKQTIYIREYKNLFTNPSFEGGLTGWSYGSTYKEFATPSAVGKYALQVRTSPSEKASFNLLFPFNTTELAEKVARAGAGQYYIGIQARDFVGEGEATHKDALKAYLRVNYKLDLTAASSTLMGTTKEITLSSKAYEKTGGIFDLTGQEAWIRTDLYLKSDTPFTSQWIMVDDMEFVALNVIVEQYEGTMESVETIIPERNIIENYQNYIDGYTTADLMFPETVEVRTSTGQTVEVGVRWNYSMLDLTKIGKYTVVGALEDMKLANPNGLTVDQVVNVVAYENLLSNPSFEDHDDYWTADTSHVTIEGGVTSPVKDDALSLQMTVGRLDGYSRKWIQSLFLNDTADLGLRITAHGGGSTRMPIKNVSYLTFEYLHIKGGSSIFPIIRMDAPTKFVKFSYVTMTHGWYYQILLEADDEDIHYKPEFSNMFMDAMLNEKEGAVSGYDSHYWNPHTIEGICMRDGVDGAWIHDCRMRNMSHAFVAIESLDEEKEAKTTGVRNCIVEDNVFEGGNALYARALNIGSAINLSGIDLGHDCVFRRNKCYDMSVSSHLFGNNYLVYSNLFSYSHTTYNEDGTLFDGKGAQPWGFDTVTFGSSSGCVGTMLVNNTFYDVAGAIAVYATSDKVQNCIYANNLVVNWKSDPNGAHGEAGAFADDTTGFNYFMNNGLYSHTNATDHFMVNNKIYSTEDVNVSVAGYSGNIYADPKFMSADLTLLGKGIRQDFTLSNESPMRYAGLSLYDAVYKNFPAWERLKAEYTDINGVPYLAESPSIGAWSFCELITGDVAEVGQLQEIVARPGACFDDLALPDTVPAVNDAGIDVVLLVTWDDASFDSSKPGVITLTGELRNGPHTDLNINGRTATINVNIKDKLELMSIVTVVDMLTVLYGTPLEDAIAQLPDRLHVVEESGFEEDLPVTWICADYKPNVAGDYTFKCILPEAMLTNEREFSVEVQVRVLHEIGKGMELLINPDFIDGTSSAPWKIGWCTGATGTFRITEDSQYLPDGEPAAAIVTVTRRYASIQQNVTGQVKLMGDGKYLFRMLMRAYDPNQPIDTSTPCFSLTGKQSQTILFRPHTRIGEEYVEYYQIIDVTDAQDLQTVIFHTSTWKSREDAEDGPRSFIIAGCSLIYLGATDAEVEATLDSIDLTWNTIKGENGYDKGNIMSDLNLPSKIGAASKITWSSSDESVISNDGKVTMGCLPQTVTLTATITYGNIETIKKFTVTVPRDPELPTFTGTLSGSQTVTEGEVFKVTISLKSDKATSFNAYRFTLSFNTSKLEYVGISDPSSTVVVEGGKIAISGIGTERPITDTITLTFKAKKSGITEVKLVKVEMDSDPGASLEALPTMYIDAGAVLIDVQKAADNTVATADKDNSVVIYIVICIVAALAVCGGVLAWLIIKKKKQTPNNEA